MNKKLILVGAILAAMTLEPVCWAKGGHGGGGHRGGGGGGGHRGGGGGGGHKMGGGGGKRPGGGGGGARVPQARPGGGGGGGNRPAKPDRPSTRPGPRPGGGGGGGGDFAGILPDRPGGGGGGIPGKPGGGGRPDFPGGDTRPTRPGQGGGGQQWKPGDNTRPSRPGQGGGGQQWRPGGDNRPWRPGEDTKPWRPGDDGPWPSRPGQGGSGEQWRPGNNRPNRPDKWQNIHDNQVNNWNKWKKNNFNQINNFQVNRTNQWKNVNNYYNAGNWAGRYGSDDYWKWRDDVWDYRKDRCEEVWDKREDYWDDVFDDHWWGSCSWRPPSAVNVNVNASPWWWWQSFSTAAASTFFGGTVAAQPVVYDPGTTVIYEGDNYYVDGKPAGSATQAREAAIQLATPAVQEIPIPEPAPEGQPETWMPLGVWALTQQEQGDANMFMQLSVDKNGIVGGAYKNVMTGDEQPIVGQLDKKSQRIAWHVGDATQTVYETGFSNFQNDVASVFVHFGEKTTQTWLLVRLPSPEIPPGTVKIPEAKK